MIGGVARSRARYLAPVALLAVVLATVLVVRSALHSASSKAPAGHALRRDGAGAGAARVRPGHRASVWVIRPGDTLSRISVRTGIPVATLESLNPGINPGALQAGQRIRLR